MRLARNGIRGYKAVWGCEIRAQRPSCDWAWWFFDSWWEIRPRRREGVRGEVPSRLLAITAMFFKKFTYEFLFSISMKEIAAEYLFYMLTYMNLYLFHLVHFYIFSCQKHILIFDMDVSNLLLPAKKISKAHNATRYVKQGKKRQKNSKRTHYVISPRVVIKISIITTVCDMNTQYKAEPRSWLLWVNWDSTSPKKNKWRLL